MIAADAESYRALLLSIEPDADALEPITPADHLRLDAGGANLEPVPLRGELRADFDDQASA